MSDTEIQEYGTIVVVGGGCYGSYYVRQLDRAVKAGVVSVERVLVVDRDAQCAVARDRSNEDRSDLPVVVVAADWRDFFAEYLGRAAAEVGPYARDAIVPSPLMPHLMGEWVVARAREQLAGRVIETRPFERAPEVPWSRAGDDGTHYVSFATWMCPVNCVEPRTCPHTRDARTWSLPERLAEHATAERAAGQELVVATLHCRHRAYGVGMFDTAEVIAASTRICAAAELGPVEAIIGTVSHCHGALTRLVIGGRAVLADSHVA